MTVPVPSTLEELLSPAWLSSALQPRFPGIQVSTVTPGPVVSRISTNARFHIDCAGGLPDGLPPDLCGKGYFTEVGRSSRHVGEPEAFFYRDIADPTGMRTLRSVYADVDRPRRATASSSPRTSWRRARPSSTLCSDYTPDQTAQSLEELAKLHAATWSQPAYADAPWLASRLTRTSRMPRRRRHPRQLRGADRRACARARSATRSGWSTRSARLAAARPQGDGRGR